MLEYILDNALAQELIGFKYRSILHYWNFGRYKIFVLLSWYVQPNFVCLSGMCQLLIFISIFPTWE